MIKKNPKNWPFVNCEDLMVIKIGQKNELETIINVQKQKCKYWDSIALLAQT